MSPYYNLFFLHVLTVYTSDAFETGFIFVSGGELSYPALPEQADPEAYRKFTAVLITASQINDKVIFVLFYRYIVSPSIQDTYYFVNK